MKRRRGEGKTGRRGDDEPFLPVPPSSSLPISVSGLPIITLLTDFGTADYFVGAMKGVILSLNPQARIVDITHEIPAQDIEAGAFTLLGAYRSFPQGTVHVAVVDPGVGSRRRALLVEAGDQFFVGPDNGIFSYVYEQAPKARVFEVNNKDYFRHPVSPTFHGRDVFAPVAAAIANGTSPRELGREVKSPVRLESLKLTNSKKNGELRARIIHIDRFGNCAINLTAQDLTREMIEKGSSLTINGVKIRSFRTFFSDGPNLRNEVFGIWGSTGFLEICATNRSAAKILKAKRGQPVRVHVRHEGLPR
ncbi:MAG: SAM hydrolase/SAM-dependent halogenase family protein [Pyrinomonadaceae bacterium]